MSEGVPPPKNTETRVLGPIIAACATRSATIASTSAASSSVRPRARTTLKSQ